MEPPSAAPPRVVIAGAGVGALEAALALRELAGDGVRIELVAPESAFTLRPLSVAEPFTPHAALTLPLRRLRSSHAIEHRHDLLASVRPHVPAVELAGGETLPYDALIVAVGARQEAWLDGAITFMGPASVPHVRALLGRLAAGEARSVCFAVADRGWSLPAYELALLTSSWCARHAVEGVELTIASPEEQPLELLGPFAAASAAELLADRGIRFLSGPPVTADATIALPRLRRWPIAGLPSDDDGFIPVDDHCAVLGLRHVYAVGDATALPIKQGGLAAQQAGAAATAVARELGVPVEPLPVRPTLRARLFSNLDEPWSPEKVAARHLGPYLADYAATLPAAV